MTSIPVLWRAVKVAFRRLVLTFPAEMRFLGSLLLFWPTICANRLYCWLFPSRRRLFDRISSSVVLGVAPVMAADVLALHKHEGVRGVVNLCREWPAVAHADLYASLNVAHRHLPTIDYDIPLWCDILTALRLMRAVEKAGGSSLVHCKGAWRRLEEAGRPQRLSLWRRVLFS